MCYFQWNANLKSTSIFTPALFSLNKTQICFLVQTFWASLNTTQWTVAHQTSNPKTICRGDLWAVPKRNTLVWSKSGMKAYIIKPICTFLVSMGPPSLWCIIIGYVLGFFVRLCCLNMWMFHTILSASYCTSHVASVLTQTFLRSIESGFATILVFILT